MSTKPVAPSPAKKKSKATSALKRAVQPKQRTRANPATPKSDKEITVVGIAGSAGALSALRSFFSALPERTGMAFVVVTHLHPQHESHMADLLQSNTGMTVMQVNRKLKVRPDHVYVIPPNHNILMTDTHVDVSQFAPKRAPRAPIDFFLRSLANAHGEAVAIILSGGGTDGAVGVKAIKEEGGLVMVQDPREAEYDSMPNAAIGMGVADIVSTTEELAAKLMDIAGHKPQLARDPNKLHETDREIIGEILSQLHKASRHDFSQYKQSTVVRRIRRRMQITSRATLEEYLQFLRVSPAEPAALLNDLLIGVTNFFRDQAAWEALAREVIPSLFKRKDRAEAVRVWSIGCATGEEAYSLAMLLEEYVGTLEELRDFQVFASDIDEESLVRAREGRYPTAIEADVSPERLERFFTRQGNYYQINRSLRDRVLFTNHSILRDPPFSRQDLICCRNLLIYLQRDIQQNVLDVFHYALNPTGYLFLGRSETTDGDDNLFHTVNKSQRIFQARAWREARPHLPSVPLGMRPKERPELLKSMMPRREGSAAQTVLLDQEHRRSLEAYGPPSILVDGQYTILHLSDTAGRYLLQPKGPLTSDLLKLVRPELQAEMRGVLFEAFDKNKPALTPAIRMELDGQARSVTISVRPRVQSLASEKPGSRVEMQALVMFFEEDALEENPPASKTMQKRAERGLIRRDARIVQLEDEVQRLREQLDIKREEYDNSNEELKAGNEELQSINEEYHLTTEELETSKEELEAVNEELQTVNDELKNKLEEISRAHQDLQNVLGAVEIATLFLDHELRIERYTPALTCFFNILPTDIRRPIAHLSHKLGSYNRFVEDARGVLENLAPTDRELAGEDGEWFLVRMRPYRTIDEKIEGVVVTFVDITPLKHAETALRELNETLEARVQQRTGELEEANSQLAQVRDMFSMLFHVNPIPTSLTRLEDSRFLDINESYLEYFGMTRAAVIGHTAQELNLPLPRARRAEIISRLRQERGIRNMEMELERPSGDRRNVLASLQYLKVDGVEAMLATFIDITERVRAEQQIRKLAANLTSAEQRERHRISQVLHDDLQQRLFAVKVQLSFLQEAYQKNDAPGMQKDLANLEEWLNNAIEITRHLSIDLSPIILQGENLTDALSWLADEMRTRYGLQLTVVAEDPLPRLQEELRILLFNTVRELLFNVVKHGGVLQAEVTLAQERQRMRITVHDSGKGFDAEAVMADSKSAHGLLELRNRLMLLGCSLQVKSAPGDGTQVQIEAPVQQAGEA